MKEVANRLKKALRSQDILIRYGGDEFLIILSKADREISEKVAKRILSNVSKDPIKEANNIKTSVSIDVFVPSYEKEYLINYMIERADEAMYKAKEGNLGYYII